MIPVLFQLGPITIHSFGFTLALGFLIIAWILGKEFNRIGYSSDAAWSVVLGAMIGGVLGAKLYYLADHWSDTRLDPLGTVFSGAGLTYYGGLIGGALGVLWAAHRHKIPYFTLADTCSPFIALGYAIGRLGCLLNGDDYGRVTDAPWGMSFPQGSPPTLETVHPTQIYEAAAAFIIFGFLWNRRKLWSRRPGTIWGSYLILAGLERFIVEYYRTNTPVALSLTVAQWISVGLVVFGLFTLARPGKPQAGPSVG